MPKVGSYIVSTNNEYLRPVNQQCNTSGMSSESIIPQACQPTEHSMLSKSVASRGCVSVGIMRAAVSSQDPTASPDV